MFMSEFETQYGFGGYFRYLASPEFSVTQGGDSYGGGLCFTAYPNPVDSYPICADVSYEESRRKIVAFTGDDGSYTEDTTIRGMVGMGHTERLASFYTQAGNRWGALLLSSFAALGVSHIENQIPDFTGGGETLTSEPTSTNIFTTSRTMSAGFELTFGQRFPHIGLSIPFEMTASYDGDDSVWNSLGISVGVMIELSYGDNMGRETDEVHEADGWELGNLTFAMLLGTVHSITWDRTLSRAAENVRATIPTGGSAGPDSTEDLVYLGAVSGVLGAYGLADARRLFLSVGNNWNILPLLLHGAGGFTTIFATGSSSGRGNGVAQVLTSLTCLLGDMTMGVDEYSERQALGDDTNSKLFKSLLIGAALDLASFGIGAIMVNDDSQSPGGLALMLGGSSALAGLALPSDPSDVDTTNVTGSAEFAGIYDGSWNFLVGAGIHSSWIDLPFYTRFFVMTDAASNDDDPSFMIGSGFGAEGEWDHFHINGGVGVSTQVGGLESGAGFHAEGGLGFYIPLGSKTTLDIMAGAMAGYNLFGGGWASIGSHLGLRL